MIRVGFVIVSIAVLAALLGPVLTPYDPAAQDLASRLEAPRSTGGSVRERTGR